MAQTHADLLAGFSAEDLRELLRRRGAPLPDRGGEGRNGLVSQAHFQLRSEESNRHALGSLNTIELRILREMAAGGATGKLSRLRTVSGLSESSLRPVLEQLRLWGLLFPLGDWQQLQVLASLRHSWYLRGDLALGDNNRRPWVSTPPPLEIVTDVRPEPRPGRAAADLAVLLALLTRRRPRLTQQYALSRRDVKAIAGELAITEEAYVDWLAEIGGGLGLLEEVGNRYLAVSSAAADFFAMFEPSLTGALLGSEPSASELFSSLGGMGRSASLQDDRPLLRALLRDVPPGAAASLESLARRYAWERPLVAAAISRYGGGSEEAVVVTLVCACFWFGLVGLGGRTQESVAVGRTPLGDAILGLGGERALAPDSHEVIVQANGEVFAPPNVAPAVLFQLRRFTDRPKGAPEGILTITPSGLEECVRSGVSADGILAFLCAHSRHELPSTVRQMIEDVGRRCNRVRLIPAEVLLRVDAAELLNELRAIPSIGALLGQTITPQVAAVPAENLRALVNELRRRGYAAVDDTLGIAVPPLEPVREPRIVSLSSAAGDGSD